MEANKLHVYTGDGKGKPSAGFGLLLRQLGHGRTVLAGQFLKNGTSGELSAIMKLEGVHVILPPPVSGFLSGMDERARLELKDEYSAYLERLESEIRLWKPRAILLDELCVALDAGLLEQKKVQSLLDTALLYGETVATGRGAPQWLLARAEYVTEMKLVRHPYRQEGLRAREGVEY